MTKMVANFWNLNVLWLDVLDEQTTLNSFL